MRKVQIYSIIIFLCGIVFLFNACSKDTKNPVKDELAPFQAMNPFDQNRKIFRGVNFGNALEAPNEGDWGVTIEDEYFKLLKEGGFTSVRVPTSWSTNANIAAPYKIYDSFFRRIDWIVKKAVQNDLTIILNIHHYNELFEEPANHKTRFLALWEQIATHYKAYPAELIFEILNEPHANLTPALWNQYLLEALQVIRKTNPERNVVIGTANWGGVGSLNDLVIPESDKHLIVTVHYYNPFEFTHQGADWVSGSNAWLGTFWGTAAEKQAVDKDLDLAVNYGKKQNVPIYLGEFGAYNKADISSRARWTAYVARQAEAKDISWTYWEFCAGFGVYDRDKKQWIPRILEALVPPMAKNNSQN